MELILKLIALYFFGSVQTGIIHHNGGGSDPTPPPTPSTGGNDITSWFKQEDFDTLFAYMDYSACNNSGLFTYDSLVGAAKKYQDQGFLNSDNLDDNKMELAAFLGQASHETTGGGGNWTYSLPGSPSPYEFGFCFWDEINGYMLSYCLPGDGTTDACTASGMPFECPCDPNDLSKSYHGRGPLQISLNVNYAAFGHQINNDEILKNPDILTEQPQLAFEVFIQYCYTDETLLHAAIAFWMTPNPDSGKPSCHDIILGNTKSSDVDGRPVGYGLTTAIINGGECNPASHQELDTSQDRIGFYNRYLDYFGLTDDREKGCANTMAFW